MRSKSSDTSSTAKLQLPLIATLLLFLPNLLYMYMGSHYQDAFVFKRLLVLSFHLSIFVVLGFFHFPGILLRLFIPFMLWNVVELFHIWNFHSVSTPDSVLAMISTNWSEAFELLGGYPFQLSIFLLCFLSYLFLTHKTPSSFKYPKKIRHFSLIFSFLVLGVFVFRDVRASHAEMGYFKFFRDRLANTFPCTIANLFEAISEKKQLDQAAVAIRDWKFNSAQEADLNQTGVLIIGESARRANWSLYGYSRPTTPRALIQKQNGQLMVFDSAWTESIFTVKSVPNLITQGSEQEKKRSYREGSIVGFAKELGFKTVWLSSQKSNLGRSLIDVHSEVSDQQISPNIEELNRIGDHSLFPYFNEVLKQNTGGKLIVIHLMGSHYRYDKRYPIDFEYFKPVNHVVNTLEHQESLINAYDNSIRYTDLFLDKVFSQLEKINTPAWVIYLSDHGENLLDDGKKFGHFHKTSFTQEIPMVFWGNQGWFAQNVEKSKKIREVLRKKYNVTQNTFFLLKSLLELGDKPLFSP